MSILRTIEPLGFDTDVQTLANSLAPFNSTTFQQVYNSETGIHTILLTGSDGGIYLEDGGVAFPLFAIGTDPTFATTDPYFKVESGVVDGDGDTTVVGRLSIDHGYLDVTGNASQIVLGGSVADPHYSTNNGLDMSVFPSSVTDNDSPSIIFRTNWHTVGEAKAKVYHKVVSAIESDLVFQLDSHVTGSFVLTDFMKLAEPADAQTALLVRGNRGGTYTLDRVTMGAADSGGAGFKLLRVAN